MVSYIQLRHQMIFTIAYKIDVVLRTYTCIFALEIAIRIYGCLHWKQFWRRIRNRVDLIIVIASVIDEFSFVRESKYHLFLLVFNVCRSYRIAYLFPGVLRLLVCMMVT